MKGTWFRNLLRLTACGDLSFRDGVIFFAARFSSKPISFKFNQIHYSEVDHIFWSAIADVQINRVYTPNGIRIGTTDTIIDIGAHRGGFTSFAARKTSGDVIAFEPHVDNFILLKRLIKDNHLNNVHAFNTAVGAKSGRSHLFLSTASSRHNILGHEIGTDRKLQNSVEVNVLSLDDCLKDIKKVDMVKMDCEGAEIDILLNADDETISKIKMMAIEIHDPIEDDKVKALQKRLSKFYPQIKIVQQSNQRFSYLYAHYLA